MYVIYMQISDIKNYNMYSSMCYFDLLTFIFQHSWSIDALSWTSMWGVCSDFCQYFLDKNAKGLPYFGSFLLTSFLKICPRGGGVYVTLIIPPHPSLVSIYELVKWFVSVMWKKNFDHLKFDLMTISQFFLNLFSQIQSKKR
jgi:hypothetical protein